MNNSNFYQIPMNYDRYQSWRQNQLHHHNATSVALSSRCLVRYHTTILPPLSQALANAITNPPKLKRNLVITQKTPLKLEIKLPPILPQNLPTKEFILPPALKRTKTAAKLNYFRFEQKTWWCHACKEEKEWVATNCNNSRWHGYCEKHLKARKGNKINSFYAVRLNLKKSKRLMEKCEFCEPKCKCSICTDPDAKVQDEDDKRYAIAKALCNRRRGRPRVFPPRSAFKRT